MLFSFSLPPPLPVEQELCNKLDAQPSMCFSFKLDDADADSYDVSTAVLWLFKTRHPFSTNNRNITSENQQKIVVSEVQQDTTSNRIPSVKTIAVQSIDVQGKQGSTSNCINLRGAVRSKKTRPLRVRVCIFRLTAKGVTMIIKKIVIYAI